MSRRGVSVSLEAYAKLSAYARANGVTIAHVTEQMIDAVVSGAVQLSPAVSRAERVRATMARREQMEHERRAIARTVALTIALAPGPPSKEFPPGAFCGICAEDCAGALYQEPVGRNEALVNICAACRDEGARKSARKRWKK